MGSTFWFTVTFAFAEDESIIPPRRTELLNGLRVLVVDDNTTNRMILHDQLTNWDMTVTVAENGDAALDTLIDAARQGRSFDLAVLDMCMPGMDGLALARRISADPLLAGTGLALLTLRRRHQRRPRRRRPASPRP